MKLSIILQSFTLYGVFCAWGINALLIHAFCLLRRFVTIASSILDFNLCHFVTVLHALSSPFAGEVGHSVILCPPPSLSPLWLILIKLPTNYCWLQIPYLPPLLSHINEPAQVCNSQPPPVPPVVWWWYQPGEYTERKQCWFHLTCLWSGGWGSASLSVSILDLCLHHLWLSLLIPSSLSHLSPTMRLPPGKQDPFTYLLQSLVIHWEIIIKATVSFKQTETLPTVSMCHHIYPWHTGDDCHRLLSPDRR